MKKLPFILGALVLFFACAAVSFASNDEPKEGGAAASGAGPDGTRPAVVRGYAEAFSALKAINETRYGGYGSIMRGAGGGSGNFVEDAVSMRAPMEGMAEAPMATPAPGVDYSETNSQVKGIDEGDIVKTDGNYIYVLRENELIILKADGADTDIVSRTKVAYGYLENGHKYPVEMYVSGDRLAVISNASRMFDGSPKDLARRYRWSSITSADIYDISNRSKPKKLCGVGQDGGFMASRLYDGYIYLVTNHCVYTEIVEDDFDTFVPALYRNGAWGLAQPDCVIVMPPVETAAYTVISAFDIKTGELVSNQSVLGGGTVLYMSRDNIYLACDEYKETASEPVQESPYTVVSYTGSSTVTINRFAFDKGKVEYAASGTVDGNLLNQFSMDEFEGNLRVVTTLRSSSYQVYTDEQHGWSNYKWGDDSMSNALYVLDSGMNVIGRIEGLGEDERVYSVRFDGEAGYFVTFRQVDPLFAADLSDPENPKITSALKIPGFSNYMHVYGDGLLFGIGRDADEKTGRAFGVKLSMFDVSDKFDIWEKNKLILDTYYTEALYNHKAILISPERDIIAFPVEDGYEVYGYSQDKGFYKRAHIALEGGWWGYNTRGLYAGDFAYICSYNSVSVMNMKTFFGVAQISLEPK